MERVQKLEREKSVVVTICALEGLCLATAVLALARRKLNYVGLCLSSMVLLLVPDTLERLFRMRIRAPLKKAFMIYAVAGPVGGNVYRLYYLFPMWDKLLHMVCGILFAAVGYSIPDLMEPDGKHTTAMRCFCALATAMGVGALWEVYEFCGDQLFGLDMQNDTVISGFSSYLLGEEMGVRGELREITSVVVNGQPLEGYIDIGLHDTMKDLIACLVGSAGFAVLAVLRHTPPLMVRKKQIA